jgi:hypothetical protein
MGIYDIRLMKNGKTIRNMQIMAMNALQASSIIKKFLKIEKILKQFTRSYDAIVITERKRK